MTRKSRYDGRGVSASKSEIHDAIKHLDKGVFPHAFCKVLPDIAAGDEEWCNIMHADTAGTKPALAYAYWKESGDNSVWKGIVQDALVMNLDDLICVGAVKDIIFSSTIGRNKHLIPGEVIKALIEGCSELLEELNKWDLNLSLAGGETADVGDIVRTLDVGFTAFARMPRNEVIDVDIKDGDLIVGFSSFGQTVYEQSYNGGMGSNGLTSARHDVFGGELAKKYPESYAPETPDELVYIGAYNLTDIEPETGLSYGQLVLSPTRTYAPVVKKILEEVDRSDIHAMIHCSGGAQTKVLKFTDKHIVKDNLFDIPPLFRIIHEQSDTPWNEMYRVFNMGHRFEMYVNPDIAGTIIDIAAAFELDARIIGRCAPGSPGMSLVSPHGTFDYDR